MTKCRLPATLQIFVNQTGGTEYLKQLDLEITP
jgi:hypothetical protein